MPPRVDRVGRICFVNWVSGPTADDMRFVTDAILDARRAAGLPLMLIAIFPPGGRLPGYDATTEAARLMPVVDRLCDSQWVVLLGDDLKSALVRGMVEIGFAAMRKPGTIVGSIEEAVDGACMQLKLDPAAVLAEARARGVMDPMPV